MPSQSFSLKPGNVLEEELNDRKSADAALCLSPTAIFLTWATSRAIIPPFFSSPQ